MAYNEEDEQLPPVEDESERPTLGARIAGMAPPPVIAAAPDAPPPMPKPDIDMSKMPDAVKMLTGPASIPTPPTGSNNPQLADLAKKQAGLSMPINPVDPATHKTKPEYRMGVGSRILGAVADFGAGFNGRPAPVYIGPGATNQRFAREESQRQGELEGVNTQIGTQEKLDATNNKLYDLATKQAYDIQRGEAAQETAGAREESAKNRGLYEQSQAELNRIKGQAIQNKPDSPADQRAADANKYGLTGQARKDYILTGKLPKDFAGAGRQPTELEMWSDAFKRDNGRPPSADEIANRKANKPATRADFDKVEQRKAKALKDAQKAYNKAIEDIPVNDVEGRKQALSELNDAKDAAQQGYVNEIQTLNDRAPSGQAAKSAPGQPASKSAGNYQVGQVVNVKGKGRGKIVGINPTTKKPIVDYSGQ